MNNETILLLANLRNAVAKRTIETIDENKNYGEYDALETGLRTFGKCKRAISILTNELDPTTISVPSAKRYHVKKSKRVVSDYDGGNIYEMDK